MQAAVGIIGVGNMGAGIAENLLRLGWPVHVHDCRPEPMAALQVLGARVHHSARELAGHCRHVVVAVVDARQTADVLWGPEGVLQARPAVAQGVLLCPTLAPQVVEQAAEELAGQGVACIDAPMSGGPARAREGSMSLMVACTDEAFASHQALLQAMSRKLFRVGLRPGDGARTKLVNNLLAGINLLGAAEALALARHLGLDLPTTLDVIEQSSGQSWIGSDRMRRALADDLAPRAHMTLLAKDTGLALQAAESAGFAGPLGAATATAFAQAVQAGLGGLDDAALLQWLSQPRIDP